jgi:DNA-directed RNA polymerase subunit RPC12/RpoP
MRTQNINEIFNKQVLQVKTLKILSLEKVRERCGICKQLAFRILMTYESGTFSSVLKCPDCGSKDLMVSMQA